MKLARLQESWETLAQQDPMWAIISDPAKKGRKWDPAAFFQSGEAAINHLFAEIAQFNFPLHRGTALDFGCGLGRLTQGICKRFAKTYGIDISPTMVAEAARYNHCGSACEYIVNDSNDLRRFDDNSFDFICSSLVLQHIWPEASKVYLAEFMRVLRPGGLIFFQLPSTRRETQAESPELAEKTAAVERECKAEVAAGKPAWQRVREILSRKKPSGNEKPETPDAAVVTASLESLIEMHGIAREEVCNLLERAHGTVIRVQEDECCGQDWISFRYWVTKS
jgi:ubiquinone/menaquinone biosynthesis C-methylase UbiE